MNPFHDRTGQPVVGGQSNSSFVPSVIKTHVLLDSDDHAHKDLLLQKIWRTNWKAITTRQIEQILCGFRIPECCWDRTVFHDEKILQNSHNSHRCSGLSWLHLAKRWRNHLIRKVGSEGTPKLGPNWKLQPVACKVNMELRNQNIDVYEQRQFSLVGQNFSWLE